MSSESPSQDRISSIKKRINEISFAPLNEHGSLFEEINQDLNDALAAVEGISGNN